MDFVEDEKTFAIDDAETKVPVEGEETSDPKVADIRAACQAQDLGRLTALASSPGGFLIDELRRTAWPLLLGHPRDTAKSDAQDRSSGPGTSKWTDLPRHRDEDQVQLDVNRSFTYYPNHLSDLELDQRKAELSSMITEVLRRYPYLCYFQGYHDICQVFLLVLEEKQRANVAARLSVLRIRDFMLPTLAPTTAQLSLLPDILDKADPKLRRHLTGVEPFYALPGTLTLYAHNIEAYGDIARLFDVFLAREPVFPIYMFAQIVMDRREEILNIDEPDILHVVLGKVPPKTNFDDLITKSVDLIQRHPPDTLRFWRHISSASVLKTARNLDQCAEQTMEEGKLYFDKQAKELRWAELRNRVKMGLWTYRRPAKAMGMAIVVGVVAFYLRRNPVVVNYLISLLTR